MLCANQGNARYVRTKSWVPDAVIVVGGGVHPTTAQLPAYVEARLDVATEIHGESGNGVPIVCSGRNTPHKPPPYDTGGHPVTEARAMARSLVERGVDAKRIVREEASMDTFGNAYFSLMAHAVPAGWRRLLIVTSEFHAERVRLAFSAMCARVSESLLPMESDVAVTGNDGLSAEAIQARKEKEKASIQHLKGVLEGLDLRGVHSYLHAEHRCYCCAQLDQPPDSQRESPSLLQTY